jgi:DNA-directed RNA polymerase subunit M/transcription elongation factor TFIIS
MSDVYILCTRHSDSKEQLFVWWCVDAKGYTYDLDRAWVLPEEEARKVLGQSLDRMVPVEKVHAAQERVCRVGKGSMVEEMQAVAAQHYDVEHPSKEEMDKVAKAFEDADDELESDDEPECPWCGKKQEDWYDGRRGSSEPGDRWLMTCYCGKELAVEVYETSLSFRTAKVEGVDRV